MTGDDDADDYNNNNNNFTDFRVECHQGARNDRLFFSSAIDCSVVEKKLQKKNDVEEDEEEEKKTNVLLVVWVHLSKTHR